ncbi:MAG TPA: DUF1501 domain-containing protein [Verrucomicrobiae bacterium]|jgi:hypothetical protein|nr:DUF1501 domain-containing protein [Verrucomicrobiae bacterium]
MNFTWPTGQDLPLARRAFLRRSSGGLGALALGSLLHPRLLAAESSLSSTGGVVRVKHHPGRCQRVIYLYQAGGPSHLETFDYKPKLAAMHGQPMPESFTKGQQIAQLQGKELKCFGPQHEFKKFGRSGQELCSLFPHLGSVADELCIIRSMHTEQINHDPAHTFMNTGSIIAGRPSMGSWLLYGLGAETQDLPGFVVLVSQGRGGQMQPIAARQWHSGFLPSKFQGVKFQSKGDPVLYIRNPPGVTAEAQREIVDVVNQLNRLEHDAVQDPEIVTRINQYEMAFRMQASVPGLMDIAGEPAHLLALYGAKPGDGSFASNCLLARRLAERGVRFIQLYHRDWDHHDDVKKDIPYKADEVDRASAALLLDLKQRGMLDETLVVWGGEFGRTPMAQGKGRDHHIKGFSIWMAGGGIRGGITYGATDEMGYAAVENPVHVNDFHATMLHLFGIDHTRLTYRSQGRDFRLTDIAGEVIRPIVS